MTASHHYLELLRQLSKDSVIITPNRRLASSLHNLYADIKISAGQTCWTTPAILPVNVWIDELWTSYARKTLAPLPHILNSAQEQKLWESVLNKSSYHDQFLQVSETSRLVKSARGLLKQWQIQTDHPLFESADDYAACRDWLKTFDQLCHEHHWIDAASLPDLVVAAINAGHIQTPDRVYYAGFADLSPQLTALLATCRHAEPIVATGIAQNIQRITAADQDDEWRLSARWAKALHEQDATQTIACVIPLLDKKRDRVTQLFSEVFGGTEHFNISAGQPLVKYPVIHAALELLTLYKRHLTSESLFFILSTPFIGGGESERIKRSQFDARLRGKNFSSIDLVNHLSKNAEEHQLNLSKSCPLLAKRINDFKALLQDSQHTAPYAYWAEKFNECLSALGWPGERIINSEEFQVVDEWLKLLNEMTTLDITSPPVEYHEALRTLSQMAGAKPFQAKSPASKVQLLGVLEAAGLSFNHLFVSGMDDNSWPSQPKPNPFIPKKLQRELKMPHASAERELEYCKTMTNQFMQSADNVIFSYARNQDETIRQPSPLIKSVIEVSPTAITHLESTSESEMIFNHQSLEQIIDDWAPAHQPGEAIRGGVDIIKNQALCPFKAFAECRLAARELESPLPGLRSKERGTIMHHIMEKCWGEIHSWQRLQTLDESDLRSLLGVIIDQVVLEHASAQAHQSGYLTLEKKRLMKLSLDWLAIEKARAPFVVLNSEKTAEIKLNQLIFTVRIDRIDQLENGKKLIIDYKTGTNYKIGDWLGDRPKEPQLPLYAQLDKTGTAGIAFAQIAAGNHCFKGLSQLPLDIKGIQTAEACKSADNKTWATLTDEWEATLTLLGDDFYEGKAIVNPKEKNTCQRCGLKPLCRIHHDGSDEEDVENVE